MRRLLTLFIALFIVVVPVSAQDQVVLDRVDQVMDHLSQRLDQTVSRQVHSWSWIERIFTDAGLGCPAPGQSYPDQPNRAFQIMVQVDGVNYDYRVTGSGDLLVLCGADGLPLFRSDDLPPAADWYAWIYGGSTDQLYLVSPAGLQATVPRPTLAGEIDGRRQLSISRDGRYLAQAFPLVGNRDALLIYDFLTGATTPILADIGQEIYLGYFGSASFDAASQWVAATFVEFDLDSSEWSVALIDLETGAPIAQISRAEVIGNLVGGSAMLIDALNNVMGTFFPVPVYVDGAGSVHVQMILGFAGGAEAYPAFAWNPQTNKVTDSPYVWSSGQIHLLSGDMIYATTDPAIASIEPAGPYSPNNVIIRETPLGAASILYINSDFAHLNPRWSLATSLIAFNRYDAMGNGRWAIYQPGSPAPALALPMDLTDVHGFSGGLLTVSGDLEVVLYSALAAGTTIWQGPMNAGFPQVIWAQPDGWTFSLNEIALGSIDVEPPVGDGIVHCPGTPPSIITPDIRARVTIIDGQSLNTRSQPGTAFPIVRVLPEGEAFDVIGGPVCAGGFTWWQIRLNDGTMAWAAEGNNDRYFMEPGF